MSIIEQRNIEAKIIYDVLYNCEINGEFWHKDEEGKRKYLEVQLKKIPKSKRWARKSIKRVLNSKNTTIGDYVTALIKELRANAYFEYAEHVDRESVVESYEDDDHNYELCVDNEDSE